MEDATEANALIYSKLQWDRDWEFSSFAVETSFETKLPIFVLPFVFGRLGQPSPLR